MGVDAGCGIGVHTSMLAQAVGSSGRVVGIDLSPELLSIADRRVAELDLSAQISFQIGDITCLPFDDDTFDWLWCTDTLHPSMFADPLAPAREFARVVKPGGTVAVLYWSSQQLLPGYSLLESRLNAAFAEMVPYMNVAQPNLHFLRTLGWLGDAGLSELAAHTFVADVHGQLAQDVRGALAMTFDMFWGGLKSKVSGADWADFERLCRPQSPEFILDQPGYYAFLTYSLFQGTVAAIP
jgi:demethylmenaquinone methyltransferase/2-methoxy-6-polyprenyl-1,4-benzoquinol methylase